MHKNVASTIIEMVKHTPADLPKELPENVWDAIQSAVLSNNRKFIADLLQATTNSMKSRIEKELRERFSHPLWTGTPVERVIYQLSYWYFATSDRKTHWYTVFDLIRARLGIPERTIRSTLNRLVKSGYAIKKQDTSLLYPQTFYQLTRKGIATAKTIRETPFDEEPISHETTI